MFTHDLCIISDCHLGTPNCRAESLQHYLERIHPERLVINGDLCDLGYYLTRHWPRRHQRILQRILTLAATGTEVIYVIGNHDAPLRGFINLLPGIRLCKEYRCTYHGQRLLVTHGHRFDDQLCRWHWMRHVGGFVYELLQGSEHRLNQLLRRFGIPRLEALRAIKQHLPGARAAIGRFQDAALALAAAEGHDIICCGHIHVPRVHEACIADRQIRYINSGDWVEHCTAIEAIEGAFRLHHENIRRPLAEARPNSLSPATSIEAA